MRLKFKLILLLLLGLNLAKASELMSIREFDVIPGNPPELNRINLQKAIDWASGSGSALFVEPSEIPYPIDGGIILKRNVSLIGVHGPTPRGTSHPERNEPVGSVFQITDQENVFITVESGTQIRGIQFWYPEQAIKDPVSIIPYKATIKVSETSRTQGVYFSCLTFYGEYLAFDFNANRDFPCELMTFEHCYGYPLGGEFIRMDYCYDVPRILHCHVNPAIQRFIGGNTAGRAWMQWDLKKPTHFPLTILIMRSLWICSHLGRTEESLWTGNLTDSLRTLTLIVLQWAS